MRFLLVLFSFTTLSLHAQDLFTLPNDTRTRWGSFENRKAAKGQGGQENKGAKGRPSEILQPSQSKVLLDVQGAGIIKRIWMTVFDRSPQMLRSLRLDMYWDGETKPAVSAPLGDFFGIGLGRTAAFQNALFASPEGNSFNCYVPMPFRKGAKVVITNESNSPELLFYDINFLQVRNHPSNTLYFHAYWNQNGNTKLGEDFEILPIVKGKGRFLGCNLGIITDSSYGKSWWGEGEVKMYLDGDKRFPTLVGTGTEDYIGTGWKQGAFTHQYQGCTIADTLNRQWTFYRYHVPDPVYFSTDLRVTIQQMGMDITDNVRKMAQSGAHLVPVAVVGPARPRVNLLDMASAPNLTDDNFPDGRTIFYRLDNYSSTAYFYLDKPVNNLTPLTALKDHTKGL